jgi:hypothetical protein
MFQTGRELVKGLLLATVACASCGCFTYLTGEKTAEWGGRTIEAKPKVDQVWWPVGGPIIIKMVSVDDDEPPYYATFDTEVVIAARGDLGVFERAIADRRSGRFTAVLAVPPHPQTRSSLHGVQPENVSVKLPHFLENVDESLQAAESIKWYSYGMHGLERRVEFSQETRGERPTLTLALAYCEHDLPLGPAGIAGRILLYPPAVVADVVTSPLQIPLILFSVAFERAFQAGLEAE